MGHLCSWTTLHRAVLLSALIGVVFVDLKYFFKVLITWSFPFSSTFCSLLIGESRNWIWELLHKNIALSVSYRSKLEESNVVAAFILMMDELALLIITEEAAMRCLGKLLQRGLSELLFLRNSCGIWYLSVSHDKQGEIKEFHRLVQPSAIWHSPDVVGAPVPRFLLEWPSRELF